MPDGKEQRSHPRADLLAQVQVARDSEIYVLSTSNISRGGVFVQGDPGECPDLKPGTAVELVLFAAEDLGVDDLSVEARVVRVVPPGGPYASGFGMEFVDLEPAQAELLERLVRAAR